jgi:hypothetical protein
MFARAIKMTRCTAVHAKVVLLTALVLRGREMAAGKVCGFSGIWNGAR